MIIKLRKNAQMTIPSSIAKKMNLKEGDFFECVYKDDSIILTHNCNNAFENETKVYSRLTINCFGRFCIFNNSKPIWIKKKAIELLAFLICENGEQIRKTKICEILWPETYIENALNSLSKLYQFIVKNYPFIPIYSKNGSMHIDMESIDSDLINFNKLYKTNDIDSIKKAVEIYRGHVLQEECYEWTVQVSSNYEIKMEEILNELILYYTRKTNKKLSDYYKNMKTILDFD